MRAATDELRVLMVAQRFSPYHRAGAELQALSLARAVKRLGHRVALLTTRFGADQPLGRDDQDGVPVWRAPTVGGALLKPTQLWSVASTVAVWGRRFDVVHGHALSAATLGAIAGARVAGVPVLAKQSLGGAEGDLARIRSSRAAGTLLGLLRRADALVAPRRRIADELVAAGVPRARVHVMPNGVDMVRFAPPPDRAEQARLRRELGLPAGPLVLFVGQLVPRKGMGALLRAWGAVQRRHGNALLAIAGRGNDEMLVERAIAGGAHVRLMGVRPDVERLMRAADVLALPSDNEGMPNVALEALACGLPVVVGERTLPRELALSPSCGVVAANAGGDAALARAIVEQLDRARALRGGDEGPWNAAVSERRACVARLDIDRVAERYCALYRQLLR